MSMLKANVTVIEGKNLAPKDASGLSDPYCVLRVNTCKGTKKTSIIKKTLNPFWNENFTFEQIDETSTLVLTCWDWDKFSSDDFMGQFTVPLGSLVRSGGRQRAEIELQQRGKNEEISGHILVDISITKLTTKKSISMLERSKKISQVVETNTRTNRQCFGVPLETLLEKQKGTHPELKVPWQFHMMVEEIRKRGMDEEGIFRIGGNQNIMNGFEEQLDTGKSADLTETSIHNVTNLFKKFLRSLPTPLLGYISYHKLINPEAQKEQEDDTYLDEVKETILSLPEANLAVLRELLLLLKETARDSDKNKMSIHNLAIVVGPNLVWDEKDEMFIKIHLLDKAATLTSSLVLQYDYIFEFLGEDTDNKETPMKSVLDTAQEVGLQHYLMYDLNGDGVMDRYEFSVFYIDIMNDLGIPEVSDSTIAHALNELDPQQTDNISQDTFVTWWSTHAHQLQSVRVRSASLGGCGPPPLLRTKSIPLPKLTLVATKAGSVKAVRRKMSEVNLAHAPATHTKTF